MFRPAEIATRSFALRLAEQAGMAPMGIRGIAVRAAADQARGTPDRLLWLADLFEAVAADLQRESLDHRARDTRRTAELLRAEVNAHV